MAEPLLAVERVTCRFGGLLAVDAASITASEGQITALIGPNGAGKTTLFSIISGFIKASAGAVRYAGEDITGEPPHRLARRGIARTFQIVQPLSACRCARTFWSVPIFTTHTQRSTRCRRSDRPMWG